MKTVVQRTISGGTATDTRFPVGILRDPYMTGGTIFRLRPKSPSCYVAQTTPITLPIYDMSDQVALTAYYGSMNDYVAATGSFNIGIGSGASGLYRTTAWDLGAAGSENHELLFYVVFKSLSAVGDNSRPIMRIGKQNIGGDDWTGAGNWFQSEVQYGEVKVIFGGKQFSVVQAPQDTVIGYAVHVKPLPSASITVVDIYSAVYSGTQSAFALIGQQSLPYVNLSSPGDQIISIGNDAGYSAYQAKADLYDAQIEDVTLAGIHVPDWLETMWAAGKDVYTS
jgi:hypothetical protein